MYTTTDINIEGKLTEVREDGDTIYFACPNCKHNRPLWDGFYNGPGRYSVMELSTYKFNNFEYYSKSYVDICKVCGTLYAFKMEIKKEDPEFKEGSDEYYRKQAHQLQESMKEDEVESKETSINLS